MNVILLTAIVFTVAFVHGKKPCEEKSGDDAYDKFVLKHILKVKFDKSSPEEWKSYLVKNELCGRVPVQTFIEAEEKDVQKICSGAGHVVKDATEKKGNLCISDSIMQVYHVTSTKDNNGCKVDKLTPDKQIVIVACNKVKNHCLPVHYEKYVDQKKGNIPCK